MFSSYFLSNELFDPLEGSKEDTKYKIWQNPYSKVVTLIYVKDEKKLAVGPEEYQVLNVPIVTTALATDISYTSAKSGGEVTGDGGSAVFERGVTWDTSTSSTIIYGKRTVNGSGIGAFVSNVTGLTTDVTYYLRAYARNDIGVGYGEGIKFTTCGLNSTAVETLEAVNVTNDVATIQGEITCVGTNPPFRYFEWGETKNYEKPIINIGTGGLGVFSADITSDLEVDHTYYYRACAETANTYCGEQKSFFTAMRKPDVSTVDITDVGYNSVKTGGTIINSGGGDITKKGVCWSDWGVPTIADDNCSDNGTGSGSFTYTIENLLEGTTYYVRAYAINVKGTGYGQLATTTTQGGLCFGKNKGDNPGGVPLSCRVSANGCSGSETFVLKMSATDDAHAKMPTGSLYTYSICCTGNETLGTACSGNYSVFLKLSGLVNAHVEEGTQSNYGTSACLSTTYGAGSRPSTINCVYDTACSGLYTCLASISGYTNAHIGDCNAYPTKVCCANICP